MSHSTCFDAPRGALAPRRPTRRPAPCPPVLAAVTSSLGRWWQDLWLDERTRFLAQASDLADLERRMRRWDEADRRPMEPLL